jgi:hypothetical protein
MVSECKPESHFCEQNWLLLSQQEKQTINKKIKPVGERILLNLEFTLTCWIQDQPASYESAPVLQFSEHRIGHCKNLPGIPSLS